MVLPKGYVPRAHNLSAESPIIVGKFQGTSRLVDSVQCSLKPGLRLDFEKPDGADLSVAESMVYERELAGDVAHELETHSPACRDSKSLNPVNRIARRRAEIDSVELLANDVKMGRMRRAGGHHPEAYTVAHFHPDRVIDVLVRPAVEHHEVRPHREHLRVVESAYSG